MSELVSNILIAVVPSTIASVVTFFLSKKKYKTEVEASEIQNLKDALESYKTIIEDNNEKLKSYIELHKNQTKEIHNLRLAIQELLKYSCVDTKCRKRQLIPEDKLEELLD